MDGVPLEIPSGRPVDAQQWSLPLACSSSRGQQPRDTLAASIQGNHGVSQRAVFYGVKIENDSSPFSEGFSERQISPVEHAVITPTVDYGWHGGRGRKASKNSNG